MRAWYQLAAPGHVHIDLPLVDGEDGRDGDGESREEEVAERAGAEGAQALHHVEAGAEEQHVDAAGAGGASEGRGRKGELETQNADGGVQRVTLQVLLYRGYSPGVTPQGLLSRGYSPGATRQGLVDRGGAGGAQRVIAEEDEEGVGGWAGGKWRSARLAMSSCCPRGVMLEWYKNDPMPAYSCTAPLNTLKSGKCVMAVCGGR